MTETSLNTKGVTEYIQPIVCHLFVIFGELILYVLFLFGRRFFILRVDSAVYSFSFCHDYWAGEVSGCGNVAIRSQFAPCCAPRHGV